jgi:hypothetical protein
MTKAKKKEYGVGPAMAAIPKKPAKKSSSQRAKVEESTGPQTGYAIPPVEAPIDQSADKLARIAETLMRNLEGNAMVHWKGIILDAMKTAYLIGQATNPAQDGEDKALATDSTEASKEDAGYDCIARIAASFGDLMKVGLRPEHVGMKLMEFTMTNGQIVHTLLPTITPVMAQKIKNLTAAPAA